jgi:hypothetical protein
VVCVGLGCERVDALRELLQLRVPLVLCQHSVTAWTRTNSVGEYTLQESMIRKYNKKSTVRNTYEFGAPVSVKLSGFGVGVVEGILCCSCTNQGKLEKSTRSTL